MNIARACGPNLGGAAFAALAFIVMMDASKSAEADLQSIMAGVKQIDQAKAQQRRLAGTVDKQASGAADPCGGNRPCGPTAGIARNGAKDSADDLSQQDQLALQQAQDRKTQADQTLSNLMKKASDVDAGIVGNLK